jgi:peroxiredoxin
LSKKSFIPISIFAALFIGAIAVILFLMDQNRAIKSHLNSLTPGEKIDYFDLTGSDSEKVDADKLNSLDLSLLFIFKQPCSRCDRNIALWNRIGNILKEDVAIYGIIPGDHSQLAYFYDKAPLNFRLYIPQDLLKFKETMRLRMNLAQTILYRKGMVVYLKNGELEGEDYTYLVTEIKRLQGESRDKKNKEDVN